jgi:LPS sulfotransferase NodH
MIERETRRGRRGSPRTASSRVVRYEELHGDMVRVVQDILAFLQFEMPAGRTIVAWHQHQADELNDRWTARYRQEASVRGSG